MRLHRQFGPGLKDLADPRSGGLFGVRSQSTPTGEYDPATGQAINPNGTETINNIIINVTSW